eukprot:TRINITY_DN1902_c0_g1_i1.p1 TRINITY_DN1902_c0_g1~~TRINITY_DN1902_c0_g1_i1.p1  ORF type:complete len:207 (-),score=84.96 TRINITY_DN1902_c0_g1_i1:22-612(-)
MQRSLSAAQEEGLGLLLKAPSKEKVNELITDMFAQRNNAHASEEWIQSNMASLGTTLEETTKLGEGLRAAIKIALYYNYGDAEVQNDLVSGAFHKALKKLIGNIISYHMPNWRRQVISKQVGLPQLEEVDWRIDVKSASDLIGHMQVPTCLVNMKVNDTVQDKVSNVQFELSRERLQTVLDGLTRIRDQLAQINRT